MFKTFNYPDYDRPPVPSEEVQANDAFAMEEWKEHCKHLVKKRLKLDEDKTKLYGDLLARLSDTSVGRVQAHEDWYDECVDPLELWNIISTTHMGGQTGSGLFDKYKAESNYNNLRQWEGEALIAFKRRFNDCVDAIKAADIKTYKQSKQARDFLYKLHDDHAKFKEDMALKDAQGEDIPTTLQGMYELAGVYARLEAKPAKPSAAVFAAADSRWRGGPLGHRVG
jgi:hypothetical protein